MVEDVGRSMLLAGVAIFVSERVTTLVEMFRQFLTLHRKSPLTISTCDRPAVSEALEILRLDGQFNGEHLLNPYLVLLDSQSKIGGGVVERVKFVEGVM